MLEDCSLLMNCFCGKLTSFSPSILFSVPPFLSPLHLALAGAVAARRVLLLRAALRLEPSSSSRSQPCRLTLGWLAGGLRGKWAKHTPISGTLRALLESTASGQGVGTPAPFYQGPLCGSLGTQEEGLQEKTRQKHRAVLFPAQIPLPKSWEPSWQILWRSATAINNNMHHPLWWHCQRKTRSWFYPFPQSFES